MSASGGSIRQKEKHDSEDDVDRQQLHSLQPVRLPVACDLARYRRHLNPLRAPRPE